MRLAPIELAHPASRLPKQVVSLLDEADARIERLQFEHRDRPIAAFVPCDFVEAYRVLAYLAEIDLATGHRLLEWGSGAGVVTCLAGMLGFDAIGIEVEEPLVELSESLAEDFEVDVEFVCGSFVPDGYEDEIDEQRDINWLRTDARSAYEEIDLEPDDFDIIFAYPWPGEEQIVFDLFRRRAAEGALLLTYHGQDGMQLRRRVR